MNEELKQSVGSFLYKYREGVSKDSPAFDELEQLITQKQREARIDEKQHAVQLIYGMEKAQMAIDELNDEIAELTKQKDKG